MKYKASMDMLSKAITTIIIIVFIFIGYFSVREIINAEEDTEIIIIHSSVILLFILVLLGSWLFAPRSYAITGKVLIIERPVGDIEIPLNDILTVRAINRKKILGSIRLFGVSGLFGYYGIFFTQGVGRVTYYTTQLRNRVLITTRHNKRIMLSPDDPGMVEEIQKFIPKS
jgi:hypothetical protein